MAEPRTYQSLGGTNEHGYHEGWGSDILQGLGPKNAQPIVFHHGGPLSADDWGFPHGMCTTHAEVINPELLAFVKS